MPPADTFRIVRCDCRIAANESVNAEYRLMSVEAPDAALRAQPGQFFQLTCPSTSRDTPYLPRPMSVYEVDLQNRTLSFLYKVQGVGTRALATLSAGSRLTILGPLGHGFNAEDSHRHVLLLGRGVGLATLAPLALQALRRGARVTAILSARTPELIMSAERLRSTGALVIPVTDSEGTSGVTELEATLRHRHAALAIDYMATCGSDRLLQLLKRLALEWKITAEVALEQQMCCGLGMCFVCVRPFDGGDGRSAYRRVCWDGPVFKVSEALSW